MFPWTSSFSKRAALEEAKNLSVRTARQMKREMKALSRRSEAETTFDGVLLSSEHRLSKGHVARSLAEASSPEGALELRRVWREIDAVLGPGKSVAQVLLARYGRLQGAVDRMNRLLRRGLRVRTEGPRKLVLDLMDEEIKSFALLKGEVLDAAGANVEAVKKKLQAEMEDEVFQKLVTLSPSEVKAECADALEELERSLGDMRKTAAKGEDSRPGAAALEEMIKEKVTVLRAGKGEGKREVLSSRVRRLAEFGDPMKLGPEFAKKVKKKVGRFLPALEDIEDVSLVFMEALGAVGQARGGKAKLLRRYVEQGAASAKELERIQGYLGQLRGLLPEEIAARMKFMDGIFYKNAFEALGDFPPALRGKMSVEMVEGPLWVVGGSGPPRQFGDGCMLLTGPGGKSAIIGLGEFKAGFDGDLLHQLFVRSDGRAVDAAVRFTGADGKTHFRALTREFSFDGGKKVAVKKPPVYVYGRPDGEDPETVQKFKEMVEDQMRSGREMWKIQLPFTAKSNALFAEEALKEAVNTLKKADPAWGK